MLCSELGPDKWNVRNVFVTMSDTPTIIFSQVFLFELFLKPRLQNGISGNFLLFTSTKWSVHENVKIKCSDRKTILTIKSVMERSNVALATEYSSSKASSDMWKSKGSSVDNVTFNPRRKNFWNGFSAILRKRKLFDSGLMDKPIYQEDRHVSTECRQNWQTCGRTYLIKII